MSEQNDLDSLLSDTAAAPETVPESRPEPAQEAPAPTGETSAAPPAEHHADELPEGDFVPRKVALDERRKRQELTKKIAEYEERLRAPPPQPQPQPNATPLDWYANPEEAARSMQAEMEQRLFQRTVAMSERVMKQQHADYDEVSEVFADRARNDPQLLAQLYDHPFPAEFAYQVGQQIKLMRDIGSDPNAYRARVEAEILAKHGITPGQAAPAQSSRAPAAPSQVPRSLARDVSQTPRNSKGQFDSGPASLEDLLG